MSDVNHDVPTQDSLLKYGDNIMVDMVLDVNNIVLAPRRPHSSSGVDGMVDMVSDAKRNILT